MHVCKTDWLALPASGRKQYLHALECVCVILCKSEANKVVESTRRRETKMWNKCTREAGTGGILETSNSFLSPHTLLETSSICRYTERHEQQRGGRSCVSFHLCSQYQPLIIFTITIQTTILWCIQVLLGSSHLRVGKSCLWWQVHSSKFFVWARWRCTLYL